MSGNTAGPASDYSGRSSEFNVGRTGGSDYASSLNIKTAELNSQVPKNFSPASILDAYQQPGYHPSNGNSATDAQRQLPSGAIPSSNGYSQNTYLMRYPSNLPTRLALS